MILRGEGVCVHFASHSTPLPSCLPLTISFRMFPGQRVTVGRRREQTSSEGACRTSSRSRAATTHPARQCVPSTAFIPVWTIELLPALRACTSTPRRASTAARASSIAQSTPSSPTMCSRSRSNAIWTSARRTSRRARHPSRHRVRPSRTHARDLTGIRVAVVGTGPAAMYAAWELLEHRGVEVELYDRAITPYGLIRSGVAPDHPSTKAVMATFERAARKRPVTMHLGVEVGKVVTNDDLLAHHSAVIYATGAARDREFPGARRAPGRRAFRDRVRRLVQRPPRLRRPHLRPIGRPRGHHRQRQRRHRRGTHPARLTQPSSPPPTSPITHCRRCAAAISAKWRYSAAAGPPKPRTPAPS